MAKILLVEDDFELSEQVTRWLASDGHSVTAATDGENADKFLQSFHFDLLVLDWDLPGKSGIEICKKFRLKDESTPVLFLTGHSAIDDKKLGFETGADDYLTKPFDLSELGFRVKALLRRTSKFKDPQVLKVRQLVLEPDKLRVSLNGERIHLFPKEFAVLEFLMRHPNEVFSPEALMDRIWSDANVLPEAVSVCVRRLRRKVDIDPERPLITNLHGIGYRLES